MWDNSKEKNKADVWDNSSKSHTANLKKKIKIKKGCKSTVLMEVKFDLITTIKLFLHLTQKQQQSSCLS